ncbi:MAG: AraC family transcriptional regulator [Clostridia bacterium]|nr:AraC family transcriptional regulator [Clostridia bacterium]
MKNISHHRTQPPTVFSPVPIDDEYPFWISQYGYSSKEYPWHEIRINSDVSCLQYVISGSGVIVSGNYFYRVGQGDSFLLMEGSDQNYYSDIDNPIEKLWFNFRGILGKELIKIYNLDQTIIFRNVCTSDLITQMHNLCKNEKNPKEFQDKAAQLFLKTVQFLAKNNSKTNKPNDIEEYIRYYIDSHITENIKLSDITQFIHYTPEHIIRVFKQKYGMTPHQYIISCKLKIASAMLVATNKTIDEISGTLNYCDPHHFSAQFEKQIGCRPSEYRKNKNGKKSF